MTDELTQEQKAALASFDPAKPLVINAAEIEGLEHLVGRFVFRRPNNGDRIKIAIKTKKTTEGMELDNYSANLAYVMATFEVCCTEKPKGVEFAEMEESAPLFEMFARFSEWQEMFRLKLLASKEAAGATR